MTSEAGGRRWDAAGLQATGHRGDEWDTPPPGFHHGPRKLGAAGKTAVLGDAGVLFYNTDLGTGVSILYFFAFLYS